MSIFRTTNPLEFNAVDGIVIDETSGEPSVQGVGTGVAIMVGQFERGPLTLTEVGSTGELQQLYGKNSAYSGYQALRNKKFSTLRLIRVNATGAAAASHIFENGSTDIISFTAKQGKGVYGNAITVAISAGTTTGKKYVITDTNPGAVLPQEIYDNVTMATVVSSAVFANSLLVTAAVLSTASEPDTIASTALSGGLDGTVSDADYSAAIDSAGVESAGNVLFLDVYNTTRNSALKAHAAATQDKMVIVSGPQSQTVSAAITDAALNRDTDGRIVYAYPWVQTSLDGVSTLQSPASWYASIVSQTAPNVDPADAQNVQFLAGVTGLALQLTRSDYKNLMAAGVSALEMDNDLGGAKVKSGIVTQVSDNTKVTVSRRRMADYLTSSIGKFLKHYQNGANSKDKRTAVKAAMLNFIRQNEDLGILPKDSEVLTGKSKLVDVESLNTNETIAQGLFKILYKQRIFSSMRFIVLMAEIGQGVVVSEQ